jgi:hypothetical protein
MDASSHLHAQLFYPEIKSPQYTSEDRWAKSQSSQKENIPLLLKSYKNSYIFQDIMPCRSVKVNRHIGRTYHLHIQGRKVSQARNRHEAGS